MTEQLREKIANKISAWIWNTVGKDIKDTYVFPFADQILALIKEEYPIMYREEAEFVGWLLNRGWIPPAEAKSYVKLADDQSLPANPYPNQWITDVGLTTYQVDKEQDAGRIGYAESQQDMLKANWRKVEA